MAKITMTEAKDFVLFPKDSILRLKIESIAVRDVQGAKGTWEKLDFKFTILGVQAVGENEDGLTPEGCAEAIGSPIWGGVSASLTDNPENKLRQWVEAILGMELAIGFELDTDLLVGKEVRGLTDLYKKKNGFSGHQIYSLLPKGGPVAQPTVVPQVTVAPTASAAVPDPWASTDPWQDDEPPF